MKRLSLFLKGNVDLHDSLHSSRVGGRLVWNGINEIVREKHPGWTVRLKHETCARSDTLLQATDAIPDLFVGRELPTGYYPLASQFSRAALTNKPDAFVFSVQPDVVTSLMRHNESGIVFYPGEVAQWKPEDRAWLRAEFSSVGHLDVGRSMENFATIIEEIRRHSEAPLLIFNLSPIVPGETIYCYQGLDETYATRVRRFNLGLVELSTQTGISIIDVDSLLARHGADRLKIDLFHLTPEGNRLVAEEVVRVLEDVGLFG